MKKKGYVIAIVLLVICVLGLSGFIIYNNLLDANRIDKNDGIVETPQDFINRISKTEEELENKSSYTVNYKDFSYTAYKNENNIIGNIVIKYKDKIINKDLSKETKIDIGLHTLNSYYFDESTGLFILTLLTAPVADIPQTLIIAFDGNGNIKKDEIVEYEINVDVNNSALFYVFYLGGGVNCYGNSDLDKELIHDSVIWYNYDGIEIREVSRYVNKLKDLPKCE